MELLVASAEAADGAQDEIEQLARGVESFLDAMLEPDVARIVITDAPAVLGLTRFTELDERYAFSAIAAALEAAKAGGSLQIRDPDVLARLLLGALSRGGMLIASSKTPKKTRNAVSRTIRELLTGLDPRS